MARVELEPLMVDTTNVYVGVELEHIYAYGN